QYDRGYAKEFNFIGDLHWLFRFHAVRHELQVSYNHFLLLKKPGEKIIQEGFIRTGKYYRYFRRIVMQPLAAYFSLPLDTGEIEVYIVFISWIFTKNKYAADELCQQVLVMERHISPPVLQ